MGEFGVRSSEFGWGGNHEDTKGTKPADGRVTAPATFKEGRGLGVAGARLESGVPRRDRVAAGRRLPREEGPVPRPALRDAVGTGARLSQEERADGEWWEEDCDCPCRGWTAGRRREAPPARGGAGAGVAGAESRFAGCRWHRGSAVPGGGSLLLAIHHLPFTIHLPKGGGVRGGSRGWRRCSGRRRRVGWGRCGR